jgi:hypothetical protein
MRPLILGPLPFFRPFVTTVPAVRRPVGAVTRTSAHFLAVQWPFLFFFYWLDLVNAALADRK